MGYSQIEVTTSLGITRVTINRPTQRNSLTKIAIEELITAFSQVGSDGQTRCVLLTGSGTEAFCAGADITELQNYPDPASRREFFVSVAKLVTAMRECPVPVVSAVHGYALAGGMGLVAASDIALAADDAVFGLPEVAIGLAPMVVMAPLAATISPRILSYLALTGERIPSQEALAAGLINRIVPKSSLLTEADAVCKTITGRGPEAVKETKRALRNISVSNNASFIFELADRSALVSLGAEAKEGLAAFSEKRSPAWKK